MTELAEWLTVINRCLLWVKIDNDYGMKVTYAAEESYIRKLFKKINAELIIKDSTLSVLSL